MNRTAAAPALLLHLLHHPRLLRSDGQAWVLHDKDAALLALVVLEAPVPRARVADLLWPGDGSGEGSSASDRRALNNLRQRLFRLSRWAGQDVVQHGTARSLTLAPGVSHDLLDSQGLHALWLQNPAAAAGELLAGQAYAPADLAHWVDAARQRWRARRADALIGLVAQLEDQNRLADAVRLAQRLVADEPLMEHGCRILMRLHHRRGDRGAALAEFERCRSALYDREGEVPSRETIELSQAVSRVDASGPARQSALPLALRHPPHTVGRQADIERAEHAWQHAGVVLLQGPAGIGKSRLTADLVRRWSVGVVLSCRPDAHASNLGLLALLAQALAPRMRGRLDSETAAWLDWLATPQSGAAPAQPVQIGKLVAVLATALAAAATLGTVAVAIEDLHHADSPSLEVLCQLLPTHADAGPAPSATRWLLSARDIELPACVQAWTDRCPPGRDPLVTVAPLLAAAAREFVDSLGVAPQHPQAGAKLHSHCGGHPLFMLQVLRQLQLSGRLEDGAWPDELPLPDEAMASVSQRLRRADPATQQLAYMAALAGPDFSPVLMCHLLGLTATQLLAPWRRLEDLHIFGPRGFAHDLVREAVLSVVPEALLPLLHGEIAQALEGEDGNPLRQALHWQAAGNVARAAASLQRAAAVARHCGLMPQAIEHLSGAGSLLRQAGLADPAFSCDWEAGHLMLGYGSVRMAHDLALGLRAQAASPREQALAAELLACIAIEQRDHSALPQAVAALALAQPLNDLALSLRCRMRLGEAQTTHGQHLAALAELDQVAAQSQKLDADLQYALASDRASALAALGRREEALEVHRGYLARALARQCLTEASFSAGFCASQLGYLCRVAEAIELGQQAVDLARQAGVDRGLVLVDEMGVAGNLGDLGHFRAALEVGERVMATMQADGQLHWATNAANDRAMIYLRLGRPDLAGHLLKQPLPDGAPAWVQATRAVARARLDAWLGRPWAQGIQTAQALLEQAGVLHNDYPCRKLALEAARASGPAPAATAAAATADWARQHQHTALERYARAVELDALRQLQQHEQAAARALALRAEPGIAQEAFGYYLPELLWMLCEALWAGGCQAEGDAMAASAAAWVQDRAQHHLPEVFVSSFLQQNPVNARLVRWCKRADAKDCAAPVTRR